MKKNLSLLFFLTLTYTVSAQEGARLLTNFKESSEIENQNWAICQDDHNLMLFANRRGILTYDGTNDGQKKDFITLPTIPYTLKYNPKEGKVYVGGDNNYGCLIRDEKGNYKYYSISGDSTSTGIISKIIFTDSTVYFYGEQSISRHNIASGKLELRLWSRKNEPFTGMFITPGNTYINIQKTGLYSLDSDTLLPLSSGYLTKDDEILFGLPYDDNLVLVGKSNGDLLLFDGLQYYEYPVKDEGYLRQNILSEGLEVADSLYAFSTLEGGALVIEKKTGKLRHTINYINGLPDDEIFALGIDNNYGLWLSHQFGLTRADLRLSIDNFSIYPGLKGNLITSLWFRNELYVATSEGVYYLRQIKKYDQTEILVKSDIPQRQIIVPQVIKEASLQPHQLAPEKSRKSIFSQIFGKKPVTPEAKTTTTTAATTEQPQSILITPQIRLPEPKYFKKVAGRLKSVNYIFTKIEGLDEKCKQLVSAGNGILASTNKGLFIISDHNARAIVNSGYINNISSRSRDNKYFVATSEGYFCISPTRDNKWSIVYPDMTFKRPVYSITSADEHTVWAGGDDIAYRIHLDNELADGRPEKYTVNTDSQQRYVVDLINDTIFLFTLKKISFYDKNSDSFIDYPKKFTPAGSTLKYIFSQPEIPWIKRDDEWVNFSPAAGIESNDRSLLKIFDNLISINTDKDNIWVVSFDNKIFRIVRNKYPLTEPDFGLFVRSISVGDSIFNLSDIVVESGENNMNFDFIAPGYHKENSTQYQYLIEKVNPNWSTWQYSNRIVLPVYKPGKYTLKVRARDIWGNVSNPKVMDYTIEAPFTQKPIFYVLVISAAFILIIIVFIFIIGIRERQLKKEKHILETKVKERTAQIEAQKKEITSSIEYASRIQMAMLPEDFHFKKAFSDYFIIFNPRDIVSGDFYWIGENEKQIFFTVADCTGHGVPGAFMSALGISVLDEIITNNADLRANTVLNLMREKIKNSLHQTGKEGEATDGMDVALCMMHKNRNTIEYSGAYNPLFLFHNGEFSEYRADRMPIGIYYGEKESFTNYEINVQKGDTIYIFSDGFADQFGGAKGSKYMKYNLKKLLMDIYFKPMAEQRVILENEFESWKGTVNQIDDVTILGVRI